MYRTGSFWYAFVGWCVLPKERHIDWEFLYPEFKTWEMLLCEFIAIFVPYIETAIWYHYGGLPAGKYSLYTFLNFLLARLFNGVLSFCACLHHITITAMMEVYATWIAVYITLGFNVGLHHDGLEEEEPVNGRYKVISVMVMAFLPLMSLSALLFFFFKI